MTAPGVTADPPHARPSARPYPTVSNRGSLTDGSPLRSFPFRWGASIGLLVLGLATIVVGSAALPGAVSVWSPAGHPTPLSGSSAGIPASPTSGTSHVRTFDDGGNDSGGGSGGGGGGGGGGGSGNTSFGGGNATQGSGSTNTSAPAGGDTNGSNGSSLGGGDPSGSNLSSITGPSAGGPTGASWTQGPVASVLVGASVGALLFIAGTWQRRLRRPPRAASAPPEPRE
jgi:hypothetical protein